MNNRTAELGETGEVGRGQKTHGFMCDSVIYVLNHKILIHPCLSPKRVPPALSFSCFNNNSYEMMNFSVVIVSKYNTAHGLLYIPGGRTNVLFQPNK